jgi:hypothetical protein
MTNELSHKLQYGNGFRIYKTSDDKQEFVPSGGTTLRFYGPYKANINYYGRIYNLQLNMLQSSTYAINNIDNTTDDGSLWIKKMTEFNNSRAFDLIELDGKNRYTLYFIYNTGKKILFN